MAIAEQQASKRMSRPVDSLVQARAETSELAPTPPRKKWPRWARLLFALTASGGLWAAIWMVLKLQ